MADALQPLVCPVAAVPGHRLYPDAVYRILSMLEGYLFQSFLTRANLVCGDRDPGGETFWSPKVLSKDKRRLKNLPEPGQL